RRDAARPAFSGHSWLYCRPEFGDQAAVRVTLPPYFATTEPGEATVRNGHAARRAVGNQGNYRNGSSDRIGPAVGPRAGRNFGRRRADRGDLVAGVGAAQEARREAGRSGGATGPT